MAVPTSRSDLSVTPNSNAPAGSEAVFPLLDDYLRTAYAFIAQNYADIQALDAVVDAIFPAGLIMMWSGSAASIPSGWTLCDGSNGTPDLRNRFVVGATSTYAVGATGGATSAASDSQGAHTHTGATGSHTLTTGEMPAHTHTQSAGANDNFGFVAGVGGGAFSIHNGPDETQSTGGGGGHTHTISSDGAHTHTTATLPPYYALCFVMKT